jgi:hypothetical protein
MPVLRFELDRIKESVASMLVDRGGEINKMIIKSLDDQLTQEWVAKEIDDANTRFSMAKFIGKVSRSMAKPPVMVYIYGSMMSSIKNKLLADIVAPRMYNLFAGKNVSKIQFDRFYGG